LASITWLAARRKISVLYDRLKFKENNYLSVSDQYFQDGPDFTPKVAESDRKYKQSLPD